MPDLVATTPYAVCEVYLDRILAALVACDRPPITEHYVAAGAVAWDSCCGLLVVAPERVFRSAQFPAEGTTDYVCETSLLVVDIVVLLLRCVPTVDDRGMPPTPDAMDAAYADALTDAAIIWNELVGEKPEGWDRANVDQTFSGATGGCIGVETRMQVGLAQSVWCPDCP